MRTVVKTRYPFAKIAKIVILPFTPLTHMICSELTTFQHF